MEAMVVDLAKADGGRCNAAVTGRVQAQFERTWQRMREFERELAQGVRQVAHVAHESLRSHPWVVIAALSALAVGLVLARRAW
jgi:ElaB/YqjD/DUF883 family membrane-anchored ribosome-binding protein